jgi:hypothetical protein
MSATAVCEPAVGAMLTLAQILTRAHEEAQTHGTAECPVCEGTLEASGVDARCTSCGSRLG